MSSNICEKRSSTSNNWFDRAKINSNQGMNPILTDLWRIFRSTHIRDIAQLILIFTVKRLNGMININLICARLNILITSSWTQTYSLDTLMVSNMKHLMRHLMMSSRMVQQLRAPSLIKTRQMKVFRRMRVGGDQHAHARLFPSLITVSRPPHRSSTDFY